MARGVVVAVEMVVAHLRELGSIAGSGMRRAARADGPMTGSAMRRQSLTVALIRAWIEHAARVQTWTRPMTICATIRACLRRCTQPRTIFAPVIKQPWQPIRI